ncbi:acyltransferase [Paenibacillus sp. FSL K6-1330]|uniref:acyltransferase family protein n=1 Tax=Paenibacillus sp. FSL K6-1330 TaxID=2975292 RepID=UPI0030DD0B71
MRNFGLDVVRSIAIIMVLISHGRIFFGEYDLQWLSYNGLIGVEIFFVLSGYLIGRIIIKDVLPQNSFKPLFVFYQRRWFRTLPVYFLIMILLIIIVGKHPNWTNLIFLQNFNEMHLGFMPVSWSLSIEEWFYLLIPPLFIIALLITRNNSRTTFFAICCLVILVVTIARFYYVLTINPTWDYGVRKQIFLRLDSIMFGVLLAGIKIYYPHVIEKLMRHRSCMYLLTTFLLLFCVFYYIFVLDAGKEAMNNSLFGRTIFFNVISVSSGFLVITLSEDQKLNSFFRGSRSEKAFYFFSVTSYSVYLVHYELFVYLQRYIVNSSFEVKSLYLIASILSIYLISSLIYFFYEKPILRFRDKITAKKRINQEGLQVRL